MALSKERRLGEIVALRIKMKTNTALREDLISAIEGAFKKHKIKVDPGVRSDLIIAIPDEVSGQLSNVVLPGGTNC
jgi:hypothetical protein